MSKSPAGEEYRKLVKPWYYQAFGQVQVDEMNQMKVKVLLPFLYLLVNFS